MKTEKYTLIFLEIDKIVYTLLTINRNKKQNGFQKCKLVEIGQFCNFDNCSLALMAATHM